MTKSTRRASKRAAATRNRTSRQEREGAVTAREGTATLREDAASGREEAAGSREETSTLREDIATLREDVASAREDAATSRDETATLRDETATLREDAAMGMEKSAQARQDLRLSYELLDQTGRLAKVGGWQLDVDTQILRWTKETYRIHEADPNFQPSVADAIQFYAPEARPVIAAAVQAAIDAGTPFDLELPFVTAKGTRIWLLAIFSTSISRRLTRK